MVRYVLVGGSAYALELIILFSLHKIVGLSATTATAISFWISIVISFLLQKIFSFKNYQKQAKLLSKQFTAYSILVLFNYCFTILVVAFFPDRLLLLSRTLALVIVTTWNYLFYQQLFSNKKTKTERRLELLIEDSGDKIVNFANKLLEISETKWFMAALTTASVLILMGVSVYSGIQATKLQAVTSDQFIGTYNYSDSGTPTVDVSHTNIIKAPILWAQGNLDYTFFSLASVNIGFIFLSFGFWLFLLYKLLGYKAIALGSFMFSAILVNSTSFSINITMTTIRHIEYPIALLFIMGLYKLIVANKNYLKQSALLSLLLGLLILHDYFFLYTLAPASLMVTAWYSLRQKVDLKPITKNIAVVITGTLASLVFAKILTKLGVLNITSGYSEIKSFIPFETIPETVMTVLKETLNLFGGLIFGGPVALSFLGVLGCFGVFIACITAVLLFVKKKVKATQQVRFTYSILLVFLLMTYLVYILANLVSGHNARYLTATVYIGVAFLTWLILQLGHIKASYLISCFAFMLIAIFGYKHTASVYNTFTSNVSVSEKSMESLSRKISEEGVRVVGTPGGYQSLRFYNENKIDAVFEVRNSCFKIKKWTNNEAWIRNVSTKKTAFLVDEASPGSACSEKAAEVAFGKPSKIIATKGSIYSADGPVSVLIYDYDIRSKLSTAN